MQDIATIPPFDLDVFYVPLLLGIAFGWVLESSGFGDSRRLAAQFYFREIRVVRVMFTAIVTCMILLLWASALGLLDLERIFVNPTYLGSGILGGLLLGFGFLIGGYCPGTSLTSAATLKVDGILFVLGVAGGSFLFLETADGFRVFYDTAGALGRVTLPEVLGLPTGVVAVLVVAMAIGMFLFMGALERRARLRSFDEGADGATVGVWGPVLRGSGVALAVFLLLALALPAVGQPTVQDRVARMAPELDRRLASRDVHLDPVEVLGLVHSHVAGKRARVRLQLLDLRDESDFNLFHLEDAQRVTLAELEGDVGKQLAGRASDTAFKILISNDEQRAEAAWRILEARGAKGAYVLAGGVNLWLRLFRDGDLEAEPAVPPEANDRLRVDFPSARGDRYDYARPGFPVYEGILRDARRAADSKAQPLVSCPAPSGGCG